MAHGIASAGVPDTVREELRPISGYVVMHREGEYLIDLDARHGLRVGDLLSVVTRGKEVIHPLTKEVLGRLDDAKAVLQLTKMKSGFSVARPLTEPADVAIGDIVRRFALLAAVFRGPAGRGTALYEALREALPELEWQGFFPAGEGTGSVPAADLVFTLEDRELRLLDRKGRPLRTWAYQDAAEADRKQPVARAVREPGLPESAPPPSVSGPAAAEKDSSPVLWSSGVGVDFGPFTSLGELPGRVLMAAFTRQRDRILLATADSRHVRVFDITGGLRQLAVAQMQSEFVSPLAVAWWQPAKNGPLYLAVTAGEDIFESSAEVEKKGLASAVYEFSDQSLQLKAADIRYFFGTFDLDGDGLPETLLGQEFNPKYDFGRPYVLHMDGGKIVSSNPGFELPREFAVPGSAMGDLTGDGKRETAFVLNGVLWIYTGTERIYRSSKEMGGSISTMAYDKNPYARDSEISVLSLEVPPFRLDIDGDGKPELLVVAAETGILQVPGIGPSVKKSWLNVVKFQGGTFIKGRLPGDLEDPIQGIYADGKRVYLVATKTTPGLSKAGSSLLLTRPLEQSAH